MALESDLEMFEQGDGNKSFNPCGLSDQLLVQHVEGLLSHFREIGQLIGHFNGNDLKLR
jgi:hypothetical protein